jgi:prepilin-type N-terminal cleavage/methylation domain-containing protein
MITSTITSFHKDQTGFTLVEMAIVLLIVTLLLGGLVPTLSSQVDQRHTNDTRKQMDEIQQALLGFALINGRLPCPADGTTPTGGTNSAGVPAGQEYKTSVTSPFTCAVVVGNNAVGVLPWAALGLNETDSWGWRFTYQVTANWADSTDGTGAATCNVTTGVSFQMCSSPNLNILTTVAGTSLTPNGTPGVVVSHGKNGYGAYTPKGGPRLPTGSDADETENSNGDVNFVYKQATPTFDDLVTWISPNVLINRMVAAGRLP